jgi:hypothetical protein
MSDSLQGSACMQGVVHCSTCGIALNEIVSESRRSAEVVQRFKFETAHQHCKVEQLPGGALSRNCCSF